MLEASVRGMHNPKSVERILEIVSSFSLITPLVFWADKISSTLAFVSYGSTLLKLLDSILRPIMHNKQPQQQRQKLRQQYVEPLEAVIAMLSTELPSMITELAQKVREIDRLKWLASPPPEMRPSSAQLHRVLFPPLPTPSGPRTRALHQLEAVALAILVQMCHCRLWIEQSQASPPSQHPQWLHQTISDLGHLDVGLDNVGQALLQGAVPSSEVAWTKVDSVWEQYAAAYLDGRLVSGCCYLGCTNLDGVSEASLVYKTTKSLCSGCMKARYCSVECQRAAWCKGGHKSVCRK